MQMTSNQTERQAKDPPSQVTQVQESLLLLLRIRLMQPMTGTTIMTGEMMMKMQTRKKLVLFLFP